MNLHGRLAGLDLTGDLLVAPILSLRLVVYMHNCYGAELVRGQLFVPPDANGLPSRDPVL